MGELGRAIGGDAIDLGGPGLFQVTKAKNPYPKKKIAINMREEEEEEGEKKPDPRAESEEQKMDL